MTRKRNTEDQADAAVPVEAGTTAGTSRSIPTVIVLIFFGLLFAFYLYEAIAQTLQFSADLVLIDNLRQTVGQSVPYPWVPIIALIAAPVLSYAAAFLVSRRSALLARIAIFAIALAALSALSLTIESIVKATS